MFGGNKCGQYCADRFQNNLLINIMLIMIEKVVR